LGGGNPSLTISVLELRIADKIDWLPRRAARPHDDDSHSKYSQRAAYLFPQPCMRGVKV